MDLDFTDEQRAFAAAVTDFCKREAGTREQRGHRPHNQAIYEKMAGLGWLGVTGMVDTCLFLEHTAYGMAPISGSAAM